MLKIEEPAEQPRMLIQIQRPSPNGRNGASHHAPLPESAWEELREEVVHGFLYAHSRANVNSSKLLEVASFSYALIELLSERGLITIEELDKRKEQVNQRLAEKFLEKGMGVALTKEEKDNTGKPVAAEIDCENRLALCHAACCKLRFALSVSDVEAGKVKWTLGQPYMIRQGADGYCHHLDRVSQGCSIYADRPFVCRAYDCRNDKRIWEDFENRIVNPELQELIKCVKSNGRNGHAEEAAPNETELV